VFFFFCFLDEIKLVVGGMSFLYSIFQSTLPDLEVHYVCTSVLFRFGLFFSQLFEGMQLPFSFLTPQFTFFIVEIIFSDPHDHDILHFYVV